MRADALTNEPGPRKTGWAFPAALGLLALFPLLLSPGCRFDAGGIGTGGNDADVPETCGDQVLDPGEECDNDQLGGETCERLGYPGGNLGCTEWCTFDVQDCEGSMVCGNGIMESGERCDGTDFGDKTCETESSRPYGQLTCDEQCLVETSQCHTCGNGGIEDPEECDSTNLNGEDCLRLTGHQHGALTCGADCMFDPSGCHTCGNNIIDGPEQCEGVNLGGEDCSTVGHSGQIRSVLPGSERGRRFTTDRPQKPAWRCR